MKRTTKEEVIKSITNDKYYDDVLESYLRDKSERNEFRQEMWIILLEMKEEKLIDYYDRKILKYIYIGIINNQLKSSSSPWHTKFRKFRTLLVDDSIVFKDVFRQDYPAKDGTLINTLAFVDDFDEIKELKLNDEIKLDYINKELKNIVKNNPVMIRDVEVFKMHFYDRLSYQKISDKTKISKTNVFVYVNNIIRLLKINKTQ